ncbi:MAG: c-type cytochrome [Rhodomicrobium sp.]
MSENEPTPRALNRPWSLWAAVGVGAVLFFGALLGFVLLPAVQGSEGGVSTWLAICRAVGVAPGSPTRPQPESFAKPQPVSKVAWTPKVINALEGGAPPKSAQASAMICAACHGENGISANPEWPNLAGQSAFAIYKELNDFKSGTRDSPQMTPIAQSLSEDQMIELARYYSHFARGTLDAQAAQIPSGTQNLVLSGDTAKRLPACNSCHGSRAGGPIETPTLTAQHREYLEAQLQAFASGKRHNDIYRRMRNVADKLTPEQMKALAEYYSSAKLPSQAAAR